MIHLPQLRNYTRRHDYDSQKLLTDFSTAGRLQHRRKLPIKAETRNVM
jgi:hypothetical protein